MRHKGRGRRIVGSWVLGKEKSDTPRGWPDGQAQHRRHDRRRLGSEADYDYCTVVSCVVIQISNDVSNHISKSMITKSSPPLQNYFDLEH